MRARPVGSAVTLRVNWWDGPPPVPGDFLRTATGRCYRVDTVSVSSLRCTVLERDAVSDEDPGVFRWEWSPRLRA